MTDDDRTRSLTDAGPGRPAGPDRAGRAPGRTILVTVAGLLMVGTAVQPALGYVQGRADGSPIDESGTTSATTFEVDSHRADLTIVPADGDAVEWSVTGGNAATTAEVTESGGTATLELGDARNGWAHLGPDLDVWWTASDRRLAQVTLAVPAGTNVVVDSGFGTVRAEDVDLGDLTVDSSFGTVRATGRVENLDLTIDYGDANAPDLAVAGDLEITNDFGDVDVRSPEVPASVDVEASFGDVLVALPPGPYRVDNSSDMGDVTNGLTVEAGGAGVPVRLHASFGSVTAETY